MKKSVFMIALAFGVSSAFAQDLTSKKGEPILPEAGDWAISMDADPIFRFVGNAFNGSTSNAAPGAGFLNGNNTIIGKKFIDEKSAYRVLVRLGFTSQTYKNNVNDDANVTAPVFPATAPEVTDKFSMKNTNIGIGVGKEFRRGKTRLQGYYGADAMIWISMSSNKFTYGNTMSSTNAAGVTTTPTSTTWNTTNGSVLGEGAAASRSLKTKSGMTFGIGVRGFIGAEYFIFPKISVGAEYGWGIGYQMTGKGKSETETTGGTPTTVGVVEGETAGSSKFGFDTDLNQGTVFGFRGSNTGTASLRATFHF
ncbi:MAG: hypothetical protein IT234_06695 [Bacteroidia bacterium]|nr:hypothetical protein [Bacteroidia bacterium]